MSLKAGYEETLKEMNSGNIPAFSALDDLMTEIEDFFTFVEDYDEWQSMRETVTHDENGAHYNSEPGFSVKKLREQLGFDKEGN